MSPSTEQLAYSFADAVANLFKDPTRSRGKHALEKNTDEALIIILKLAEEIENGWLPIAHAPRDGTRIDIAAKIWIAEKDTFAFSRFPGAYWMKADISPGNRPAHWANVDKNYCPVYWRPIPEIPKA